MSQNLSAVSWAEGSKESAQNQYSDTNMRISVPHGIYITPKAKAMLELYIEECNLECSGLGKVRLVNGKIVVEELFFLSQRNTGGSTDIDMSAMIEFMMEHEDDMDTIKLWWHSHVNMGVFWSGIDVNTINRCFQNAGWYVSIVGNKRGQYLARLDFYHPMRMVFDNLPLEIYMEEVEREGFRSEVRKELAAKSRPGTPAVGGYNQAFGSRAADWDEFDRRLPNQRAQGTSALPVPTTTAGTQSPRPLSTPAKGQKAKASEGEAVDWANFSWIPGQPEKTVITIESSIEDGDNLPADDVGATTLVETPANPTEQPPGTSAYYGLLREGRWDELTPGQQKHAAKMFGVPITASDKDTRLLLLYLAGYQGFSTSEKVDLEVAIEWHRGPHKDLVQKAALPAKDADIQVAPSMEELLEMAAKGEWNKMTAQQQIDVRENLGLANIVGSSPTEITIEPTAAGELPPLADVFPEDAAHAGVPEGTLVN